MTTRWYRNCLSYLPICPWAHTWSPHESSSLSYSPATGCHAGFGAGAADQRQHPVCPALTNEANLVTREKHLGSEAGLLADQLETFHGSLRESTQRLAGLFEQRFSTGLQVRSDERVSVGSLQTPALYLGLRA